MPFDWNIFDTQLLDVHCHHPSLEGERVIQQDVNSVAVHPWYADMATDAVMNRVMNMLQNNENQDIVAIGECGIDKLCTSPLAKQIELFKKHVEWSEQFHLPLIIHCVKAIDELLAIKKELSPTQPWIWHGFRGKPQQLEQLLRADLYISFGYKYNKESLLACPPDRMFIETDTLNIPVSEVKAKIMGDRGISNCAK